MSKPFKMRGPTFFKSAVKKYNSPANQGRELNPSKAEYAPGNEPEEWITPAKQGTELATEEYVPTADEQTMADIKDEKKMEAAGGRKWKPGGSPATQVNPKPAKRGAGNLSEAQ